MLEREQGASWTCHASTPSFFGHQSTPNCSIWFVHGRLMREKTETKGVCIPSPSQEVNSQPFKGSSRGSSTHSSDFERKTKLAHPTSQGSRDHVLILRGVKSGRQTKHRFPAPQVSRISRIIKSRPPTMNTRRVHGLPATDVEVYEA